jgi:sigma-B regulation protein RsbU (phosphoserine phosphatase)
MLSLPPEHAEQFDRVPCGLLETDAKGVILKVNKPFCTWLGYAKADLVGKKRLQDLLTMGARIFHQTHWAPLLEMQGSISELKLDVRHKDGSLVPMVLNVVRHGHGTGHTQEVAAFVARDRDKYEQELLLSRKKLEAQVAEIERLQAETKDRALFAEQMVGIVSHDLRNPLSAVNMGIQVLHRHSPTGNQARVLSRMSQAVDRANRLVSDLLDFTVARVGKGISVHLQTANLHEVVAQNVAELALAFPARRLLHAAEGQDSCLVDPDRVAQLVGNMVANAFAYGDPAKEVTVTSSVDLSHVELSVHNWGTPIPVEKISSLFKPMVRGTAAGAGRSVGLGLFIIMEIAKAHGGQVTVDSSIDRGTSFVVALSPS